MCIVYIVGLYHESSPVKCGENKGDNELENKIKRF